MSEQMKKYSVIISGMMLVCVILLMDVFSLPKVVKTVQKIQEKIEQKISIESKPDENEQLNKKNKSLIIEKELKCGSVPVLAECTLNDVNVEVDMFAKSCSIVIKNGMAGNIDKKENAKTLKKQSELIQNASLKMKGNKLTIKFKFEKYSDVLWYVEGGMLYIACFEPKQVYDNIVVIDAGHGGVGVGTSRGEVYEKDINLRVTKRLKTLLDKQDVIKAYYTRLEDVGLDVFERVNFANDIQAQYFVSIHSNSYEDVGDIKGVEVLYSKNEVDETYHSKWFSKILLNQLVKVTGLEKRGLIDGDYVHIVRTAKMPVALIEMGYMTNDSDYEYLISEEGQEKLSEGIYQGLLKTIEKKSGITENDKVNK